ncbi:hypothetical protein [Mesorhizobium japonicum]|uniref:Mll0469 protein n=1 Tax=Mesorhizobium japonicum (strain LMG 29417 / CECT 9101 / MAFF 303099) TaxID=266835 RepID=Q98MR5_RHILO|nr:hypothetical protein [Mesorhizobium japonicum]BAB48048.1 mll0469 [Mesorhizobium japonicum MAFF 303099]
MSDEQQAQMPLDLSTVEPSEPDQTATKPRKTNPWTMDWDDGEEIVVNNQSAIAVYTNQKLGIVIRQERTWDEEEDTLIILSTPGAAYRVIEAIQRELEANKERKKNGG